MLEIFLSKEDMGVKSTLQLTGIELRSPHHATFLANRPGVAWIEVPSEHYFVDGGKLLQTLTQARANYPISLHSNSLSLGSADDLNWQQLKRLRDLVHRIEPCLISDHLSWSSVDGHYFHDFLPLPYTEDTLKHVVGRIKQTQDYLQRQILIENIANYITFDASTMCEWEFLTAVAQESGCGILLDITSIYISAINLHFDAIDYLSHIPKELVQQIHLSGFSSTHINKKEILIASRDRPIVPAVSNLYRQAIKQFGAIPTIIEWNNDLPSLDTLCLEAYQTEKILREAYAATKPTI